MKITLHHPASAHGMPVILDDKGNPMQSATGIREIRRRLELSVKDVARICDVSPRSVEGWELGRSVPAQALNALSLVLIPQNGMSFSESSSKAGSV